MQRRWLLQKRTIRQLLVQVCLALGAPGIWHGEGSELCSSMPMDRRTHGPVRAGKRASFEWVMGRMKYTHVRRSDRWRNGKVFVSGLASAFFTKQEFCGWQAKMTRACARPWPR